MDTVKSALGINKEEVDSDKLTEMLYEKVWPILSDKLCNKFSENAENMSSRIVDYMINTMEEKPEYITMIVKKMLDIMEPPSGENREEEKKHLVNLVENINKNLQEEHMKGMVSDLGNGVVTGAETGTELGTTKGTETGTERGTERGTETGTERGTVVGITPPVTPEAATNQSTAVQPPLVTDAGEVKKIPTNQAIAIPVDVVKAMEQAKKLGLPITTEEATQAAMEQAKKLGLPTTPEEVSKKAMSLAMKNPYLYAASKLLPIQKKAGGKKNYKSRRIMKSRKRYTKKR